jgi:hypothetical protein
MYRAHINLRRVYCSVYSRCYAITAREANKQTAVSEQRLDEHVPAETNTHAAIDLLLETGCFVCGPCLYVMSRTV